MLTDLEFRVWWQYIMSADDFGVILSSPSVLQSANRHLRNRPTKMLRRCLDVLESIKLVRTFSHQRQSYLCQHDWQDWQRVMWPTRTILPKPPSELILTFTPWTQLLFSVYPGGCQAPKKPRESPEPVLQSTSQALESSDEVLSHRAKRLTLTANSSLLIARTSEGSARETAPPFDVWLRELQDAYPPNRVTSGRMTEDAFLGQFPSDAEPPSAIFRLMMTNLATNVISHEWRIKGMVPRLDRYLREGLWRNVHASSAPVGEQLSAKTNRTLAAAAEILSEADR